jgi:hypothetical protein
VGQQRLDRNNNEDDVVRIARIDANFDDIFDLVQVLNVDFPFIATTAAQQLLNGSPNGAINLDSGLYEFETMFSITNMSTSSGTFGFALGGTATFDSQQWTALANSASPLSTESSDQVSFNIAANTALDAAATTGVGWAWIRGLFRLLAKGTVIPQVSFSTVGTIATVKKNSFFRVKKLSAISKAVLISPPMPLPSANTPFWS